MYYINVFVMLRDLGSLKHQEEKYHVLLSFLPPFAGWATRFKDGGVLVGGQWVYVRVRLK